MRLVIKIGGHLLSTTSSILNSDYIKELVAVLNEVKKEHKMIIVTGGGLLSRFYIKVLRNTGKKEALCDLIGIEASRLNALLLSLLLEGPTEIPRTIKEVLDYYRFKNLIVMGGLQPGQSTTTTAAVVAEAVNADLLVIATNVDGIYTSDPSKDPNARKIDEITLEELKKLFMEREIEAGTYPLIDYLTIRILERAKIQAVVVNGRPPTNIVKAIRGESVGTRIKVK